MYWNFLVIKNVFARVRCFENKHLTKFLTLKQKSGGLLYEIFLRQKVMALFIWWVPNLFNTLSCHSVSAVCFIYFIFWNKLQIMPENIVQLPPWRLAPLQGTNRFWPIILAKQRRDKATCCGKICSIAEFEHPSVNATEQCDVSDQ